MFLRLIFMLFCPYPMGESQLAAQQSGPMLCCVSRGGSCLFLALHRDSVLLQLDMVSFRDDSRYSRWLGEGLLLERAC